MRLSSCLDRAIKEVLDFEDLADDLIQSKDVEKLLIDKVLNSLQGDDSYDALSKSDIDNLICSFREIKDAYCMPDGVEKLEREAVLTLETARNSQKSLRN